MIGVAGVGGGNLPGPVQPWKSIEEVQQILRDLGMRQAICTPVFEGPELAIFTTGILVKILQPQYLLWGAGIHAKPSRGRRHLWCWAIHRWSGRGGKTQDGGNSKSQKAIPISCKGLGKSNPEAKVV